MKSFLDYYTVINSSDRLTNKYVREECGKVCRFCKRSYPDVRFMTLPHIVPELFGRNKTSSNFECDECNSIFQKYESDASTMVQHYLSILNVKSKKGVPNFRSRNGEAGATSIMRRDANLNIMFGTNLSDFKYDYDKKTITLFLRTRRFSPFSIYKVLLKIGISLMDDEQIEANEHFLEFLNADEPIRNGMQVWQVSRYMLKTRYYEKPIAQLYKAKETVIGDRAYPEFVLVLYFANIVIQMCLPISEKNYSEYEKGRRLIFELFPAFALEDIDRIKQVEMYHFDLDETRKVSITDTIVLHYDSIIRDGEKLDD